MKLYYHKTDGEAEYLCSNNIEGTNEGCLKSKYIIRIDGNIEKDAELMIKNKEECINKDANGNACWNCETGEGDCGTATKD